MVVLCWFLVFSTVTAIPQKQQHYYQDFSQSYSCGCPMIYDPFCGKDGILYSNPCLINCLGVFPTSQQTRSEWICKLIAINERNYPLESTSSEQAIDAVASGFHNTGYMFMPQPQPPITVRPRSELPGPTLYTFPTPPPPPPVSCKVYCKGKPNSPVLLKRCRRTRRCWFRCGSVSVCLG